MAGRIIDVTMQLIDKVTAPLQGVTGSLANSNRQWRNAGKEITNTGRDIANVGQGLTTAITLPLAAAGTAAVTNFADMDKTMSLVNATMQNSTTEARLLEDAMSSAAANSTFGMSDAAQAALNFARGGWDAEQAANALAPAMNLAAGEGGSLDTVSAGLMATMNAFKAPAEQAADYADVFANACNNSALDVDSLSNAMSVAGPSFSAAGLSVQDATLAMGAMAQNGIDANVAANSLKTGIARLASPAKEGAAWMDKLGIAAFDSNGKMKDMATLQDELSGAFSGLSAQEKEAAASAIFGKNQMTPWLALIDTGKGWMGEFNSKLTESGTASSMADAMMSGFGGSIEKLKSSVDVLMNSLGKVASTYIQPVVNNIQGLVDKFNNLDDSTKDQIVRWAGIAAAVGPAVLVFGKIVGTVGKVVTVIGNVGKAIKVAGGLMSALASPGFLVVAALAAIAAAAVLVVTHWDQVKAAAQNLWTAVQPVVEFISQKWQELSQHIQQGWATHIQPAWAQFTSKAQELWTLVQPVISKLGEIFREVFEIKLKTAIDIAVNTFKALFDAVSSVVEAILGVLSGIIDFVVGVFTGDWDRAWNGVLEIFNSVWEGIKGIASAACDFISGLVGGIVSAWQGLLDLIGRVKSAASGVGSPGHNAVGTSYWKGGTTWVNERGAELIDLPRGTRIYPHSESLKMAYQEGQANAGGKGNVNITVAKLADSIQVRNNNDIEAIAAALANKLEQVAQNIGGGEIGYVY